MTRKNAAYVSGIVVSLMLLLSAYAWIRLPDNVKIATHFGLSGNANGYGGKVQGLLLLPLLALGIAVLLYFLPYIEPRRENLLRSAAALAALTMGVVILLGLLHASIVARALGKPVPINLVVGGGVGILFMVIGNYMGKFRSNYLAGIRTPWTLTSDLSWNRTHRLGGRLFFILGLVLVATSWTSLAPLIILAGAIGIVVVCTVYSYLVWRGDPNRVARLA